MNVQHLVIGKKIIHNVDNSEKGSDEWMKDLELKNLMLVQDYIAVVGSSVGGKGSELDDVDIVVKDSVIPSRLMTAIQQLLKGSAKEVDCVPDPAGPRTNYITLYDLVLVRRSELKEVDVPVVEIVEVDESKQIYRDVEYYHQVPAPMDPMRPQEGIGEKPETTEGYHRVPVSGEQGKHKGHPLKTIVISKKKVIKALYCTQDKKNVTYLFDVNKWTMVDAQKWVEDHKFFDSSAAKAQDHFRRRTEEKKQSFAEMFESQGVLKNCTGSKDHSKLFDLDKYDPTDATKAQLVEDLRTASGWKKALLNGKRINVRSGNDMAPLKARAVELLIRRIKGCQ